MSELTLGSSSSAGVAWFPHRSKLRRYDLSQAVPSQRPASTELAISRKTALFAEFDHQVAIFWGHANFLLQKSPQDP